MDIEQIKDNSELASNQKRRGREGKERGRGEKEREGCRFWRGARGEKWGVICKGGFSKREEEEEEEKGEEGCEREEEEEGKDKGD